MNTVEYFIKQHQKDIYLEVKQIQIEQLALHEKPYSPNFYTRLMEQLGKWLISCGETLVRRYEIPKTKNQPAGQNIYIH
ncbi:MAG: hypothetical protein U0Z26_14040 [Anaerolineales bacterium]